MKKTLVWILILALLSVASVLATLAFLVYEETAENIMTVGKVSIELLEYERVNTEDKNADNIVKEFVDNKPLFPAVLTGGFDYSFGEQDTAHVKWDHDSEGNEIKVDYTSPIWDPDKISNEIDKMVFVRNSGDYSAYVRVFFAFEAGNYTTKTLFDDMIHINLNDKDSEWKWEWIPFLATDKDGHNYFIALATYQKALAPESVTEISLSQIALDSFATNADVDAFDKTYNVLVHAQGIQSDGFGDVPEDALIEGFGRDIPFDMTLAQGVDLKTALHNLNGDGSKPITSKVATVTFGLNETYPNIVKDNVGTFTSVEQDAMVYTYYVPNATKPSNYDIYVLADDTIYTPKNSKGLFGDMSALTTVDTTNMDVSRTENMYTMFYNCTQLTSIDVSKWNTENVTNMGWIFGKCSNLTSLDVSGWDVSNVTTMAAAFREAGSLTALDVSDWNVGKVTDMKGMFDSCQKLSYVDVSGWDVSNVTSMDTMFYSCANIKGLEVGGWDVSNVTTMYFMFNRCSSITSLDVDSWNVGSVTTMSNMFAGCTALETLDVSEWDVSKVVDFQWFIACVSPSKPMKIKSLDVSKWNTGSATNMFCMFYNCTELNGLNVSNWNVSNVTTLANMFEKCKALETLDLSKWDVSNVENMDSLFYQCGGLTELNLSGWNTVNVKNSVEMFNACSNLETIYVDENWNMHNVTDSSSMFLNCLKLVGGNGTTLIKDGEGNAIVDKTYARVDTPENPGYLTLVPAANANP